MTWLLDTNVVSEASKPRPDPCCLAWLESKRGQCALSVITLSELRYGLERLPDGKRKTAAERELNSLIEDYGGRFYDFDGPAATEWGRYAAELEAHAGPDWWKQFDLLDTQIAATAREYGLPIATRNVKHFPFCQTVDPFDSRNPPA